MSGYRRDLAQMFRGAASIAAVTSDFGAISLYNNGGGDQLIAILDFNAALFQAGATPIQGNLAQGRVGTAAGSIVRVLGEAAGGPGEIDASTIVTLPTSFDYSAPSTGSPQLWQHDYPFQILLPGWSFTLYAITADVAFQASFMWQVIGATEAYLPEIE